MANDFKSNEGTRVTKNEAKAWIEKYDSEFRKNKEKDTKSIFFGRDALLKMLSEEGSTGISFFLAVKFDAAVQKETVHLVLVPTKEDGTLMWPEDGSSERAGDSASAYDQGFPCPPYCPK